MIHAETRRRGGSESFSRRGAESAEEVRGSIHCFLTGDRTPPAPARAFFSASFAPLCENFLAALPRLRVSVSPREPFLRLGA